jgi:hypothetical protein
LDWRQFRQPASTLDSRHADQGCGYEVQDKVTIVVVQERAFLALSEASTSENKHDFGQKYYVLGTQYANLHTYVSNAQLGLARAEISSGREAASSL